MWKTIKYWWVNHLPFITTKKKEDSLIASALERQQEIINLSTWIVVNPVIQDLEKLKKNTWDIDKVERMKQWLINNFNIEK